MGVVLGARVGVLLGAGVSLAVALVLVVGTLAGPVGGSAADGVDVALRTPEDTTFDPLAERSVVHAADGSVLAVLHAVDRRVVGLDRIPEHVRQAVLAAEDQHFHEHHGFDLSGIGRAALANLRAQGIEQGGSTITQQLAKQNFVGDDRTLRRKFSELAHAVALENELSKDELLERYLNQVYFGAGAYGVAAAAEEFLPRRARGAHGGPGRPARRVDPRPRHAGAPGEPARGALAARRRARGDGGPGPPATSRRASGAGDRPRRGRAAGARDHRPLRGRGGQARVPGGAGVRGLPRRAVRRLLTGGLRIHTTLDPDLQGLAHRVFADREDDLDGPTAAIAAVDPRDGRVVALHSGADFEAEQFDLAVQARRPPGSAFKAFVVGDEDGGRDGAEGG